MDEKKINWVSILSVFSFLLGVYYLLDFRTTLAEAQLYNYDNSSLLFLIPCRNILAVLLLISGVGLMFRYEWARKLALPTYVYNVVLSVITAILLAFNKISDIKEFHLVQNSNAGFWVDYILSSLFLKITISPLIPPVLLFYYFTRPKIKEQFKNQSL